MSSSLAGITAARAAAGLPVFPGGGLPVPESVWRKALIRCVAISAIAVSLAYLTWRALFTLPAASWWVSFPFFALEILALTSLALFVFSLWDVDVHPRSHQVTSTDARIAVFIPTYNESQEILIPTIAAAVALELAHETWVLDDGNRPDVEQLAGELGARYLSRVEDSENVLTS